MQAIPFQGKKSLQKDGSGRSEMILSLCHWEKNHVISYIANAGSVPRRSPRHPLSAWMADSQKAE